MLELGQVRLFWKLIRLRIWQQSHSCQTGVWKYFPNQFSIEKVRYEDGLLILGQNDLFCSHNVVIFSVWFLQLTAFKYLVPSHVTEQGSLLTEPGTVSSVISAVTPVHVCYNSMHMLYNGVSAVAEVHLFETMQQQPEQCVEDLIITDTLTITDSNM